MKKILVMLLLLLLFAGRGQGATKPVAKPVQVPQLTVETPAPMMLPKPLKPGSRVAIIALSSPSASAANIEKLVSVLKERFGYIPQIYPSCLSSRGYLAGKSDKQKADDLHRAFEDPNIDGIICLRGGYGAGRVLPYLDPKRIAAHPKVFIGYSDITAVHSFLNQKCNMITFHGPMVISFSKLVGKTLEEEPIPPWGHWMQKMLEEPDMIPCAFPPPLTKIVGGKARGEVVGGNLTVLGALIGTPWELELKGKILFIEDVGEKIYRIDRVLSQMLNTGKLKDVAGILIGDFEDCKAEGDSQTLDDVINDLLVPLGKPILKGLRAGHGKENYTIPLGATAELNADMGMLFFTKPILK